MWQKLNLKQRFQSKKFRRKVWIAAAVFILVFAAAFTLFINPLLKKDKYIYKEAEVNKGNLVLGIQESGSLDLNAKDITYDIVVDTDDDDDDDEDDEDETKYLTIEEIYIAAGQRVNEGDSLIKLTDASVAAVRKQLESLQTEAEITLAEAKAEYNISVLSAKSTYDTSMITSNYSDSIYTAQSTTVANEIKKLESNITVLQGEIEQLQEKLNDEDFWTSYKEAKTAYTAAENTLNDTSINNPAGYTSNYSTFTQAKSTFEQLQSQLDTWNESIDSKQQEILEKQKELSEKQSQASSDEMTAKQTQESAKLSGETAEEIYGYTISSLEESVTSAENALSEAQSNLEEYNEFVGEDNIIHAPENGMIVSLNYDTGDELVTTGAVLSYSTGKEDTLSVDVAEEDVPSITVGDNVDIVLSAYPDETYSGTITEIETKTTDNHASTVNYPVTILVNGDTDKLYGGMIADVTFAVESRENVLYVSKKAIVEDESGNTCIYQKNSMGKMILTQVTTGFTDGTNIEIVSGLQEGDVIYIASKVSAENAEDLEKE